VQDYYDIILIWCGAFLMNSFRTLIFNFFDNDHNECTFIQELSCDINVIEHASRKGHNYL